MVCGEWRMESGVCEMSLIDKYIDTGVQTLEIFNFLINEKIFKGDTLYMFTIYLLPLIVIYTLFTTALMQLLLNYVNSNCVKGENKVYVITIIISCLHIYFIFHT